MPRLAAMMSKFVVIRSLVGAGPEHSAGLCLTGYKDLVSRAQGGRPSLGAVVSELQGPFSPDIPPFVGLSPRTAHPPWGNPGEPGYLGLAHAPFTPFRSERSASRSKPGSGSAGLSLDERTIVPARLARRRSLLIQLDDLRRSLDHSEAMEGMDAYTRQAFDILFSRRVFEALDLGREDPRLRAKYGVGDMINEGDGAPCCMDHFLMARRLVEAGVRVVTISFGRWDTHSDNFGSNRRRIPKLDMALAALVEDLHMRGLDRDVSVVVWGEFGRTPRINQKAGRDHWQPVSFALLAGGGMRTGQVIGSTDKLAAYPNDRPVWFQNVFATLYHNLGIDPATTIEGQQVRHRANFPVLFGRRAERKGRQSPGQGDRSRGVGKGSSRLPADGDGLDALGSQDRAQSAAPRVPPVVADGCERNQALARRPDRRHLPVRPVTGADLFFGLSRGQPPERRRRLPDDPERPIRVALDEDDRRLGTSARNHDRVDPRPLRAQCKMG